MSGCVEGPLSPGTLRVQLQMVDNAAIANLLVASSESGPSQFNLRVSNGRLVFTGRVRRVQRLEGIDGWVLVTFEVIEGRAVKDEP